MWCSAGWKLSQELLCLALSFLFSVLCKRHAWVTVGCGNPQCSVQMWAEAMPRWWEEHKTALPGSEGVGWKSLQRWGNAPFKSRGEGTACSFHHSNFLLASVACLVTAALWERIKIRCTRKGWNQPFKRTDLSVVLFRSPQTLQQRDPCKDRNPRNLWFRFSCLSHWRKYSLNLSFCPELMHCCEAKAIRVLVQD